MRWSMLVAAASLLACEPRPRTEDPVVKHAELGVFFGGQVQERSEIPFVLDQTRQTQGVRIDFRGPLAEAVQVRWEIDMPGTTRRVRDTSGRLGRGRVTRLGQATVAAGQARWELPIVLAPGDPLGVWNVRLLVDDRLVFDQRFLLYDAAARERLARDAGS